ncbi:unnamed protein product [Lactuca saligna]|uniref:Uncharacterized protein n=1 Tax=Lactuca saligna TaxID=75948 RepID=A0AA35YTU7_LACSI|nr:unnamed protein product [Lactuca saligna]
MTSSEEYIYNLLDSYWYKQQILTPNPPSIRIPDAYKEEYGSPPSPKAPKDEFMALKMGNCRNDVEMKGSIKSIEIDCEALSNREGLASEEIINGDFNDMEALFKAQSTICAHRFRLQDDK